MHERTGQPMARLKYIWVIHTTSTADNADTDDGFSLEVRSAVNPNAVVAQLTFPTCPTMNGSGAHR
jgi:hypothetical protein